LMFIRCSRFLSLIFAKKHEHEQAQLQLSLANHHHTSHEPHSNASCNMAPRPWAHEFAPATRCGHSGN
jgi:hypothetical protein